MTGKIAKKAVLVFPLFDGDSFWRFSRSLDIYSPKGTKGLPKRVLPPLGLLGLYNHLNISQSYDELKLVDRSVDPTPLERIISGADDVYIGGMAAQQKDYIKIAKVAKRLGKRVVAGGTIVDEKSPLMQIADHLVENEAEMVIDDLLKGLQENNAEKFYRGTFAAPEKFFRPDFSALDFRDYVNMAIQFSRGCPERCEFCDIRQRFGSKMRITPWEYMEASFRQLFDLGSRQPIMIVDDNFNGHRKETIKLLKKAIELETELGYKFPLYTQASMRLSDD